MGFKVFLGGTCSETNWRDKLKPLLVTDYFDPVVKDWNDEAKINEEREKISCDLVLIVITPQMKGVFSIAEAVEVSNKNPEKLLFVVFNSWEGLYFSKSSIHSLNAVTNLIKNNGCKTIQYGDFKDDFIIERLAKEINDISEDVVMIDHRYLDDDFNQLLKKKCRRNS